MVRPAANGSLEDDSLVVAFTLTLRFDAIGTSRALFTALDAAFTACQAASLGPSAHFGSSCGA